MDLLRKLVFTCALAFVMVPALALSQVTVVSPPDGGEVTSPPVFEWSAEGSYDMYKMFTVFNYEGVGYIPLPLNWFPITSLPMPEGWFDMLATGETEFGHVWAVVGLNTSTLDFAVGGPWTFTKEVCNDLDGDGYGNPASSACLYPEEDCDDSNPDVNPWAVEGPFGDATCSDTLDNNCDGDVDDDDLGCWFPGGSYYFKISFISQDPGGCMINPFLLAGVLVMLQDVSFPVTLPAYTPDPFLFVLPLPFLGVFQLEDTVFGEDEVIFPPQTEAIDFGPIQDIFPLPGLNCLVSGTAGGGITSLNVSTLPAQITISDLVVSEGSGEGECTILSPDPDPSCTLIIDMEGT